MKGGKRKGSGRKKLPYKTITKRFPEPCWRDIQRIIKDFKAKHK